jgi:DNA-directed RNA polymerase subunit RPC12/RpoP
MALCPRGKHCKKRHSTQAIEDSRTGILPHRNNPFYCPRSPSYVRRVVRKLMTNGVITYTCARCGTEVDFWQPRWALEYHFPLYNGKRLCTSCKNTLLKSIRKYCPSCGKKIGFLTRTEAWKTKKAHPAWLGLFLHSDCWRQETLKIESELRTGKLCANCGYFNEIIHSRAGFNDEGIPVSYSTHKCRKFSLDIEEDDDAMAEKCSSYIHRNEYREKCLNGDMEQKTR